MVIEVGNNFIRFELFSPSFSKGEQPLFTLEVEDGVVVKASVVESARSVVKEKLDRISHVGEYMIPLVGNDFFETTDAWTAQAVTKQLVGARTYTIDWCKDPENEGYYPEEYMSELLCNSEKDLVTYKAKLTELQSHDGALV